MGTEKDILLESISKPQDLQELSIAQLPALAAEIRRELLQVVSANGGHLSSNLGAVELTIALLYVFGEKENQIVWDTGHQAYTYKLLTGRRDLFKSLRQSEGCCGFLSREESEFDAFGAGHAGTAISAATGLAVAREYRNNNGRVLAVVGDGALGCGISLEGLNNVIEATNRLIVVLNDNKMSISPNVGALSRYLNRIISDRRYNRFKGVASRTVERIPGIGNFLHRLIHRAQEGAKSMLVDAVFFEELGFRYIGPLNGHDLEQLITTLDRLKPLDTQPLLIHVLTEKGRGYTPAEKDPASYHGLESFNPETGQPLRKPETNAGPVCSFGDALGDELCRLLKENSRLIAVTAGMCDGTGLKQVRENHAQRFFDVGIAEEHAVVFAAGMATQGMIPVVAIYASFMQRALDYVFHDVALQKLPVVFCLDRAGVVEDGPTHHGIHDLGFWQGVPNIIIMHPANAKELHNMLQFALTLAGPCVIRYPKCSNADEALPRLQPPPPLELGRAVTVQDGKDVALWCLGHEVKIGLEVARQLAQNEIQATVINPRFVKPFEDDLLKRQARQMPIVTIEDHCLQGGLGTLVNNRLANITETRVRNFGWPVQEFVPWGPVSELRKKFGMDSESIAREIRQWLAAEEQ